MPANLTPQYMEAEKRFKQAKTTGEKVAALEEMMATIPRHKGTEKLQAELKKKMSALRKEAAQKKAGGRHEFWHFDREGARQLALAGAPNAGKSRLITRLTHATPEVADYPFTTRAPFPGTMRFENVRLQLVDLPPISPDFTESWVPQIVRNADAVLWVLDLANDDVLERLVETRQFLVEAKADLFQMKTLLVGNKRDDAGADDRAAIVLEACGGLPFVKVSAELDTDEELETFKRSVYDFLDVVRVYTKAPGKKADFEDPHVLPRGATVLELAGAVHRDFAERLQYARVWGHGKADGIMVSRDFVLSEGDILELHVS